MSSLGSDYAGWYKPSDLVLWRSYDGSDVPGHGPGSGLPLDETARNLMRISLVEMNCTLDGPWELVIREAIKPGNTNMLGQRYFELEQELWLTDRPQAPSQEGNTADSTRILFYGRIKNATIAHGPEGPFYEYRLLDRRGLSRDITVTAGGPNANELHATEGANRVVYNAPAGDTDGGFGRLGGNRNSIFAIIQDYFTLFADALTLRKLFGRIPALGDFIGWRTGVESIIPGKIVIEDANFEEGLIQILSVVPYVKFYVTPGGNGVWKFVSPLRLGDTHILQVPAYDSPAKDYPISTAWEINTENVFTAVKIQAKTGKIKNNWTRQVSGFGFEPKPQPQAEETPQLQPDQPGQTIGIKVNSTASLWYQDWASESRRNGTNYWTLATLPQIAGKAQPIYMLAMWLKEAETAFVGDQTNGFIGFRNPAILAGHVHGGSNMFAGHLLQMAPINNLTELGSATYIDGIYPGGRARASSDIAGGWLYRVTDTAFNWLAASPSSVLDAARYTQLELAGPWGATRAQSDPQTSEFDSGSFVMPPQPNVGRPSTLGVEESMRFNVRTSRGNELIVCVAGGQQAIINKNTFAGAGVNPWFYELHEPIARTNDPDRHEVVLGGLWSSMFRNYRMFDPELVWKFVAQAPGAEVPRFVAWAPEVCAMGIFAESVLTFNPGSLTFDPGTKSWSGTPLPDPDTDTTGAWKREAHVQFFPIYPKLGGSAKFDAGFFSLGSMLAVTFQERKDAPGIWDIHGTPFDAQFGWYEAGGHLEARYPSGTSFDGEGKVQFNIQREKVISVDLSEFRELTDIDFNQNSLGARLEEIARQQWLAYNKVSRVGSVTLFGLDMDLVTWVVEGGNQLPPFSYYIALNYDQPDIRPGPVGDIVALAATLGVRYNFESAQTVIDLTQDRSGLGRDLLTELLTEFRSRQLLLDIRHNVQQLKSFRDCLGSGNAGGGGGTNVGGNQDLCAQKVPHPNQPGKFISICALFGVIWNRTVGSKPQPKDAQHMASTFDGLTTQGGMFELDPHDDYNPATYRYDEFPHSRAPIDSEDFNVRGSEILWDAANQRTVQNFYGKHNRYTWLGAALGADGITTELDTSVTPKVGGWIYGAIAAYFKDFLGWDAAYSLELSEDEETFSGIYSTVAQSLGLRNTSLASWRLFEEDEIPTETALYLDFEEASGSLYDLSRQKYVLAATGSPTYGVTGLTSGELGITTVQGSSSFAVSAILGGSQLQILHNPFALHIRFKLNSAGISHTLISAFAGNNGFKVEINASNQLVFTVGDGATTAVATHTTAMSSGNWYEFWLFNRRDLIGAESPDGTIFTASATNLGAISLQPPVISGSVTWDELAMLVGSYVGDDRSRSLLPASWKLAAPVWNKVATLIDTADANGGTAALRVSVVNGSTTSPVLLYQETGNVPGLALIPGHTYRLTVKNKTVTGSPGLAPWIENLDRRQILTSGGAFTDADTALSLTTSSSAWTTNTVSFTVPTTYSATDRWRIGVRITSSSGTVVAKFGGVPAIYLEEIDASLTGTEYELVDSNGVRVAALGTAGTVAAVA